MKTTTILTILVLALGALLMSCAPTPQTDPAPLPTLAAFPSNTPANAPAAPTAAGGGSALPSTRTPAPTAVPPTALPPALPTVTPAVAPANYVPPAVVQAPPQAQDSVVVTFAPNATDADKAAYVAQLQAAGATVTPLDKLGTLVVTGADSSLTALSALVVASEPDYLATSLDGTQEPDYDKQWGLTVINAPAAWAQVTADTAPLLIAVIDSGVCADHPELAGRIVGGYDWVDGDSDPQDVQGHGCAVTGIIAAATNGAGIAGIVPNARILALRVLDARGVGRYSDIAAAIVYAVDSGARIVNLSLGGPSTSTVLQNAVAYAAARGVTLVAAAGNNGTLGVLYPAAYPQVVAVGALDPDLQHSAFSSFGPDVDTWAPGRNVRSLGVGGTYVTLSGTSFAAPHVTGIAALEQMLGGRLTLDGGVAAFGGTPGGGIAVTPTPPGVTPTVVPTRDLAISQAVMSNPAATYCGQLGYIYSVDPATGAGTCVMPDGTTCPSWDFVDGVCGQAFNYCAKQGYGTQTVDDPNGSFSARKAVCVDAAGSAVGTVMDLMGLSQLATSSGCALPNSFTTQLSAPPSLTTTIDDVTASSLALPASFNWRSYRGLNWLTSVRDQGQCGSCWAFGAVAGVEAVMAIAANDPNYNPDLSEQYLVSDCSSAGSCCGGWHGSALDFFRISGVPDEACMPYVDGVYSGCSCGYGCDPNCTFNGGNGVCSDRTCTNRCGDYASRLVTISASGWLPANRDTIKQYLVTQGPIVVAIGISGYSGFSMPAGGVARCTNDSWKDHVVLLVGYNDAGGYWILQNSWGSTWDGDGFFFMGYGECGVETEAFYVSITQTTLATPALDAPAHNASIFGTTVDLSWNAVPGAYEYNVQISTSSTFTTLTRDVFVTDPALAYQTTLPDGTYYWRVAAVKLNGRYSLWSASRTFVIDTTAPALPVQTAPLNNATVTTALPVLTWGAAAGATGYEVRFGTDNPPTATFTVTSPSFTPPFPLSLRPYYWQVRARDNAGNTSAWTGVWTFTVASAPSAVPARNYYTIATPTLRWSGVTWATGYEIQVDNQNTFVSPEYTTNALTVQTVTLPALTNGTYYWRVRAKRTDGTWGAWSVVDSFVIDAP